MAEHQSDHDILVEVKTIQQLMVADIREIKEGTSRRLSELETGKADKKDLEKLADVVDDGRTFQNRAIGGLVIANLVFGIVVSYYISHH